MFIKASDTSSPEDKMSKTSGCLLTVSRGKVAVGSLPTSICRGRTKSEWRSRTDLHFTALPFSRRQSPSLYFQPQQKELLARRAPEGCNPSLRKKRGAGLFKRTCSLVFITSTFGFFPRPPSPDSPSNWFLHVPLSRRAKKSVARQKGATCAPSWPRFQLSGRTLSLGRWKTKEEQPANVAIVQLNIFCFKSKLKIFIFIIIILICWAEHQFVLCWQIFSYLAEITVMENVGDGRWLKLKSIISAHEKTLHIKESFTGAGWTKKKITEALTNWSPIKEIFDIEM